MTMVETISLVNAQLKRAGLLGSDVKAAFFDRTGESDENIFRCKECHGTYKSKNGYSNLISHATSHQGWLEKIVAAKTTGGPLDQFICRKVSTKAFNLFRWIEQCIMNDEPFDFVENPYVRKNSRNEPISVNTLIKYMELVRGKVEIKLKALINGVSPKRFGLVFDYWT